MLFIYIVESIAEIEKGREKDIAGKREQNTQCYWLMILNSIDLYC